MTRFSKPAARLRTLPPPLCECDGCAELSPHRSGAAVARNNRVADVCSAADHLLPLTGSPIRDQIPHHGIGLAHRPQKSLRRWSGITFERHYLILAPENSTESDYKDINSDCENILCASASYISPLCNTFYFRWSLCWFPPLRENFACLIAWPAPWRRGQDSS